MQKTIRYLDMSYIHVFLNETLLEASYFNGVWRFFLSLARYGLSIGTVGAALLISVWLVWARDFEAEWMGGRGEPGRILFSLLHSILAEK